MTKKITKDELVEQFVQMLESVNKDYETFNRYNAGINFAIGWIDEWCRMKGLGGLDEKD